MHTPAILVIIYNRGNKTERLIASLNKLGPCKIYICADGPKSKEDEIKVNFTRRATEKLSPKHQVTRLYSDANLGCGSNCTRALDWFFSKEPEGIILEDDIEFDNRFVAYATVVLDLFRGSKEILLISGSSYLNLAFSESYLSIYPNIWGWATWRSTWNAYRPDLEGRSHRQILSVLRRTHKKWLVILYWFLVLRMVSQRRLDSWDHQMYFSIWEKGGLTLVPKTPLTKNIGFDTEATTLRKRPSKLIEVNLTENPSHDGEGINPYSFQTRLPLHQEAYDQQCEKHIYRISIFSVAKLVIKNIFWKAGTWKDQ